MHNKEKDEACDELYYQYSKEQTSLLTKLGAKCVCPTPKRKGEELSGYDPNTLLALLPPSLAGFGEAITRRSRADVPLRR